jgi:hypothetical protein
LVLALIGAFGGELGPPRPIPTPFNKKNLEFCQNPFFNVLSSSVVFVYWWQAYSETTQTNGGDEVHHFCWHGHGAVDIAIGIGIVFIRATLLFKCSERPSCP